MPGVESVVRTVIAALPLALAVRSAHVDVKVWVVAPANLADAERPMPELRLQNDTADAIVMDLFGNVPFIVLERQGPNGELTHDEVAIC